MVEVGLAMTILIVAVMAMTASNYRMHALRRQNRERVLAQNAVRSVAEQIQATAQRLALESPESWSQDMLAALSPGGALGDTFAARELEPQAGEAAVGSIQVIVDETTSDGVLGLDLGLPRDLDGDGLRDNADVSATARILPVVLRLRWSGSRGDAQIAHCFYVIGY
jgi:hypothetical protein